MSKRIPLTQEKFATVDDEDFEYLIKIKWLFNNGYARAWTNTKDNSHKGVVFMHRLLANTPKEMITDHINGNTLDNRKSNLRICSVSQNAMNVKKLSKNKSGYKGVYWNKRNEKWHAQIQNKTGHIHIGYFDNLIEAAKAYDQAALKHHGEFASLNFGGENDL